MNFIIESSTTRSLSVNGTFDIEQTQWSVYLQPPQRYFVPRSALMGSDAKESIGYESPLKRVKRAVAREANKRVIDTVDDLKAFIIKEDPINRGVPASVAASIVLRMRVVWTSFDTCSTDAVARIHLVDQRVDDDVGEMHKVFKDGYEDNKGIIDSELVTASLYGVDDSTSGLPVDGAIAFVSRMWSLKLFAKQSCCRPASSQFGSMRSGVVARSNASLCT